MLQLQAYIASIRMTEADIEERYWRPHNEWAGDELYSMCVDLRGFYLKVGLTLYRGCTTAMHSLHARCAGPIGQEGVRQRSCMAASQPAPAWLTCSNACR